MCHRSGLQRTDRLGNEPPRYLCHKLCRHQRRSSRVLRESRPQVSFSFRKQVYARAVTACSPCGPGKPLDGQPKGWPSVPRMVYSCSMPNQGCWSFTISIIFLHVTRRLVSADAGTDQNTCTYASRTAVSQQSPLQSCLSSPTASLTGTCRLSIVLQHFTQNQLVGVPAKRVPEHGSRDQVHVAVGALCLVCARAVKVPLR